MKSTTTTRYNRRGYYRKPYSKGYVPNWERRNVTGELSLGANSSGSAVMYTAAKSVKLTNLQLTFANESAQADTANLGYYYAMVYVPDGYSANGLNTSSGSELYEPTQNVLMTGYVNNINMNQVVQVPIAKKLKSGDTVEMVVDNVGGTNAVLVWLFSYTVVE